MNKWYKVWQDPETGLWIIQPMIGDKPESAAMAVRTKEEILPFPTLMQ